MNYIYVLIDVLKFRSLRFFVVINFTYKCLLVSIYNENLINYLHTIIIVVCLFTNLKIPSR